LKRRRLLAALCTATLFAHVARGQQAGRIHRVGFLTSASPDAYRASLEALIAALAVRGYVQGRNLQIEQRWSEEAGTALEKLAGELAEIPVDVIVTWGTSATAGAQKATRRVPIVMANTADPLGSKFVQTLGRPGGNITGVSSISTDLSGKVLSLLKEIVPKATRIGVLRNPANPVTRQHLHNAQRAARDLNIELVVAEVAPDAALDAAFARLAAARVDGAIVLADPTFVSRREQLASLALKHRLPVAYQRSENVEAGGLISYSADLREQFRLAAGYVHRILQGAAPGELPVVQPTKVELVANLKTARALGIAIPQAVLLRADRVIE
jgi:putative tryptophan/tyrosine transport system substrate-binding protein